MRALLHLITVTSAAGLLLIPRAAAPAAPRHRLQLLARSRGQFPVTAPSSLREVIAMASSGDNTGGGSHVMQELWRMGRPKNIPLSIALVLVGAYAGANRSWQWVAAGAAVRWRVALSTFLVVMVTTTSCERLPTQPRTAPASQCTHKPRLPPVQV